MSLFKKLSLIFCFCFGFVAAKGQYRFDRWTADNGLPQNSVYGIVQTRDGYLWLATVDGLARFDGARFTVFNKSNSPGIVNNRFVSLFEDARGDLWAGTEESGVARLHAGRFTSYGAGDGVPPRSTPFIVGDREGNPVFGSESQLIRFSDGRFSPFEPASNPSPTAQIVRRRNVAVACTEFAKDSAYKCLPNGGWLKIPFSGGSPLLRSAAQDADGTLWLLTGDRKLLRVDGGGGESVRVLGKQNGLPEYGLFFVPGSRLSLLSQDAEGAIWLTDLPRMQTELFLKKTADTPFESVNLSSPNLPFRTSYQDGEGNVWLGTPREGLFRARKQVITAYSKSDGLLDNNVYPIYETRDGTIWVGTTRGLFTYQNGIFAPFKSAENFYVNAIGEDGAGRVLVSHYGALYVREGNGFVPFHRETIPVSGTIFAIHAARDGAVWIGGENGLRRFQNGVLETFTTADGLAGNDVKVVIEDRAGGLWIGSYGGLSHFKDGKFTSWTESDGLPSRTVRALYTDADGALWIGTYDGGLARFKDGKFTHYTTRIGLSGDGAFQILEDGRRNFWISSNRGVYRVSLDELNEFADGKRSSIMSVAYGKSDGMLNAECNGGRSPAGIRASDGRLWFPTQDGVAVVNPETVPINPQPPPVVIETIRIDNVLSEPPALAGGSSATENPPADAGGSDIVIEPHQQNFEIQYTALSFVNSENLRFKYRLEGLDDRWIDAGTRRTAYFSRVPAGEYTFRVIAANSDGIWNETGESLRIKILPPFYRTWWFVALVALAVSSIAYFLFNRRIVKLERDRLAQQTFARQLIASQEQERKRIAAELHDSLGQRLVVIKNLALMFLNAKNGNAGDTPQIEEISSEASEAIGEVKAISYNLRPYQLDRIGLTKALEAVVRAAQTASEIDFAAEIDDIDDYFPKDEQINFYRIVQESVNNAVKHSGATEAFVKIKRWGGMLELEIADNGCGFNSQHSESKTGGFGLIGISERAELLGGRVEIKSAPEHGTAIKISIKSEQ